MNDKEKQSSNGEGFFLALMWILFGWFPWFMVMGAYLHSQGRTTIPANDPVNVTIFILSYLTFPFWMLLFGICIGTFINFCEWLMRKVY